MKKLLGSLFVVLLMASPAWAVFGSVATLGTGNEATSDTSLVLTTGAQLDSGNIGLCATAFDNTGTTDGDLSEVSSVADGAGNTYSKLAEFTNGEGAAAAGITVSAWLTKATSNLASGGTITFTYANAITAKAASCWEFTVGGGNTIQIAPSGSTTLANDAGVLAAMTLSALANKEYLFFRPVGLETNSATALTPTTDYTAMGEDVGNGGSIVTSAKICGEFRILTATGDTSDPGNCGGGGTTQVASIYMALEEVAVATISRRSVIFVD